MLSSINLTPNVQNFLRAVSTPAQHWPIFLLIINLLKDVGWIFSILVLTSADFKQVPSYRLQVTAGWLLLGLNDCRPDRVQHLESLRIYVNYISRTRNLAFRNFLVDMGLNPSNTS